MERKDLVQVINNVRYIKDAKDEYELLRQSKHNDYWSGLWFDGKCTVHSNHCMKEYIVQQIHAGRTVKITGEVIVIE